jgi:cytochrome c1
MWSAALRAARRAAPAVALSATASLGLAGVASADEAEHGLHAGQYPWPHDGAFSSYDHASIRRGHQVRGQSARPRGWAARARAAWGAGCVSALRPKNRARRQVYQQVCAACHSVNQLSFRNLVGVAYSEAEVKALAEEQEARGCAQRCAALPLTPGSRRAAGDGRAQRPGRDVHAPGQAVRQAAGAVRQRGGACARLAGRHPPAAAP